MSKQTLVKSAAVISLSTVLSRILGLVRTIAEAAVFGRGLVWDAFQVAWLVPNFLRRLFGEGALTSSFIPVFTGYLENKPRQEAWRMVSIIFTLLVIVLAAIVLLGGLGISAALRTLVLPERIGLILRLSRLLLPYIFFISLVALGAGVLNSFRHFAAPALAPAALNVFWISALLFVCPYFGRTLEEKVYGLAVGIFLGGAAQVVILLPALLRRGLRIRWEINPFHPAVKAVGRLMLPAVFALAVTQVNIMVDRFLGLFLGKGAVSSIYYGNRLIQFPLAVFGVALGTAVLPTLSSQAVRGEMEKLKETLSFALRLIFFITIPAAVGLVVLRYPIITCFFERGRFTPADTEKVALVVFFYSLGLFAYAGIKVVVPTFYSLKNTAVPVKVGALSALVNLILNLCLMWRLREGGLALATALSGALNFVLLFWLLRRKIGRLEGRRIVRAFGKTVAAAAVMGVVCTLLATRIDYGVTATKWLNSLIGLMIPLLGGVITFAGAACLFRIEEARMIGRWILRKK